MIELEKRFDKESISKFNNEEFLKIMIFYVLLNPCERLCSRFIYSPLSRWSSPWKKPFKLNEQLKKASTNPKLLFSVASYARMEEALEESNLKDNYQLINYEERVCFYNCQKNQFMSVFYHIRNSLAHSRFTIKEIDSDWLFIFEDRSMKNKKDELSARMILRKSTLLKWIEIIEGGEKELIEK
ncbi:MAG: hypothetical protein K5873_12110 [Treponema sp.]|nr:hypothetical protein [Treponema sp.]